LLLRDFSLLSGHLCVGLLQLVGAHFHGLPGAFEGIEVVTMLLQQVGVVLHELDRVADAHEEISHVGS
jgi:hypothetical protein